MASLSIGKRRIAQSNLPSLGACLPLHIHRPDRKRWFVCCRRCPLNEGDLTLPLQMIVFPTHSLSRSDVFSFLPLLTGRCAVGCRRCNLCGISNCQQFNPFLCGSGRQTKPKTGAIVGWDRRIDGSASLPAFILGAFLSLSFSRDCSSSVAVLSFCYCCRLLCFVFIIIDRQQLFSSRWAAALHLFAWTS